MQKQYYNIISFILSLSLSFFLKWWVPTEMGEWEK